MLKYRSQPERFADPPARQNQTLGEWFCMASVPRICSFDGCGRKHHAKGYCKLHHQRLSRTGTTEVVLRPQSICSAKDCGNKVHSHGLCGKHGRRMREHGSLDLPVRVRDNVALFWSKVKKTENCWLWTSTLNGSGYGIIYIRRGKPYGAHRFSFELHKGVIPEGMFVCHTCDTPACVNPEHLWVGTPAENSADMVRKNRKERGSAHYMAKLTEADVVKIRRFVAEGKTQTEVAQEFGVTSSLISAICRRKCWRHVR